jgi:hypothetical protein
MSSTVNAVRDGEEQPGQNIDAVIDAIAKDRRRILLDVLDDEGGGTFSEVVARVSEEIYGTDYSSKERKRVYVSLYQNHVPRLGETGVVVFEGTGDDDRIYPGPTFPETKDALDSLRRSLDRTDEEKGPRFRTLRDLI